MDQLRRQIHDAVSGIRIDFGGGCSVSKGYLMGWLIREYHITNSVDIGVYRGRSLVPQAVAHKEFAHGKVYGVDPYLNAEAKETGNPSQQQAIDKFIDGTDFPAIYGEVNDLLRAFQLNENCTLIRERSQDGIHYFEQEGIRFGLIHIDGNHDSDRVNSDVALYLPRLTPGGFVVMDDVSWDSVKPALVTVASRFYKIYERTDAWNDYAVFWDASSWISASLLRLRLKWIGRD